MLGQIGGVPGFQAERVPEGVRRKLRLPPGRLAVFTKVDPESSAYQAGLRDGCIVYGIEEKVFGTGVSTGKSKIHDPDLPGREFLAWFRATFDPGATIKVYAIVMQTGRKGQVVYSVPAYTY